MACCKRAVYWKPHSGQTNKISLCPSHRFVCFREYFEERSKYETTRNSFAVDHLFDSASKRFDVASKYQKRFNSKRFETKMCTEQKSPKMHFPSKENPLPRILVIDDSIADLRVLMDMLNAQKWRIAVAFDGNDGYQKATLNPPDLILLDVRMPGVDGFGTCRLLKADPRTQSIPIIFLSAAETQDDRLTGLHLGAVDYILKPYVSEEEVIARIGIHLDLANRGKQAEVRSMAQDGSAIGASATSNQSPLVRAATALLLENITYPPSPEDLAKRLGTNEKRLNEAFQTAFSQPIFGWLRHQRLRIASELLEQTDTSIGEIALHCGYSTAANFSTAFRERFNVSPRAYRQDRRTGASIQVRGA